MSLDVCPPIGVTAYDDAVPHVVQLGGIAFTWFPANHNQLTILERAADSTHIVSSNL